MKPSQLTEGQLASLVQGSIDSSVLEYENTGPGKFEGNANPGLTEALYTASLDTSWIDEETGRADGPCGWAGRIGRFVLFEDDRGFVESLEFLTVESAEKAFATIDFDLEDGEF